MQREIWRNMALTVGYIGSKGEHLRTSRNLNQFVNGVRPYPLLAASSPILPGTALGNITAVTSLGRSRYDGLWTSVSQRLSHGLQFNASYTLSKSKDTNSLNSQGVVVQDSNNIGGDYALSDYDARHRYVVSAIWELPFKGNGFVEGWQLAVTTQGQSGNPVNILTNIGTFTGNTNLRPDLIGNLQTLGNVNQWFANSVCDPRVAGSCTSSSVFRVPGVRHGRVPLREPGTQRRDWSFVLQHGPVGHQEDAPRRGDDRSALRGVQRAGQQELRSAGAHRHGGQHVVRGHHQHALRAGRLRVVASEPAGR